MQIIILISVRKAAKSDRQTPFGPQTIRMYFYMCVWVLPVAGACLRAVQTVRRIDFSSILCFVRIHLEVKDYNNYKNTI